MRDVTMLAGHGPRRGHEWPLPRMATAFVLLACAVASTAAHAFGFDDVERKARQQILDQRGVMRPQLVALAASEEGAGLP